MARLLFIDDDPIILKIGKAYFSSKGHTVNTARDGREGVSKFKQNEYDMVVTDLMMPNVHGYQVIDEIKLSDKGRQTPIILLTADANEPELDQYERRSFQDDTVTKPFDMNVLEKAINDLFSEIEDRKL